MLTRKWLLTTVVCGGLLAICSAAQAASPSGVLQPDSDWAISKLSTARGKGAPYCALARRFSGNVVLTMARNAGDESSVAIDFQHVTLSNARDYHIELDAGFGQRRSFNVMAVSGKALVARLGKDYAFYDAMNRSGQIEISVEDQPYTFNLAGLEDGQRKLGDCLASLVEPAAGGEGVVSAPSSPESAAPSALIPAPDAAPAHDITEPSSAMQPVPSEPSVSVAVQEPGNAAPAAIAPDPEIQTLREENSRLRGALESERRTYEDRLMDEGKDSSKVAELNEKLRLLQSENDALRKQASAPAPAPAPAEDGKIAALEQENALLREANENLQSTLDARQDLSAKADAAMEKDLVALRTENESLKKAMGEQQVLAADLQKKLSERKTPDAAQEAVIAQLRERVTGLEKENESLKLAASDSSNGAVSSPGSGDGAAGLPAPSLSQLRALEEKLQTVQADRDQLLQKLDDVTSGEQKERIDISSKNWDLEQATRRYNDAEIELRRLGRELEQARAQCSVEKKELEYMLFDPDVATKAQTAKLMELEKRNGELTQKISALELEKAEHEQKIAVSGYEQASIEPSAGVSSPAPAESIVPPVGHVEAASAPQADTDAREGSGQKETAPVVSEEKAVPEKDETHPALASAPSEGQAPVASPQPDPEIAAILQQGVSKPVDDAVNPPADVSAALKGVNDVLERAHVALDAPVEQAAPGAVPAGVAAFRWNAGSLFGTAEQAAMADAGKFDETAQRYLGKIKARCDGEFAAKPGRDEKSAKGGRVATYEVACINGETGAAVAAVFYAEDGMFTAISHETSLDDMDAAIDTADMIAGAIAQGRVASK